MNHAVAATQFKHQRQQQHLRHEQPGVWVFGKLAVIAGGVFASITLKRAAEVGESQLLLTLIAMMGGVAALSAFRIYEATLTSDAARLMLPLPLDPATRWRAVIANAALSSSFPALALIAATLLSAGWQWAVIVLFWIPVTWSIGAAISCTLSWSLGGGTIRWRVLVLLLLVLAAIGAAVALLVTTPNPLAPLTLLPDAVIIGGLSLGPGASFIGRIMIPISQQSALAPPKTFAAFPRLTARIAGWLEKRPSPVLAIVRKDVITQSRDAFSLLRIVMVAAAFPASLLLARRLDSTPDAARIATIAIAIAFYALLELRPSPFGGEGNRLMLAMQSPIAMRPLLAGKVLGILVIELPQSWIVVSIASIGASSSLATWATAFAITNIAVIGIATAHTAASVWDIDLERRVEDRTQALLVEHVPIGARRMLTLGLTALIAAGSIISLLVLPLIAAIMVLIIGGYGYSAAMSILAIHRLTAIQA